MDTGKLHLFTLDSHDYFGPFENEQHAHEWAKATGKSSYQLTTRVGQSYPIHKPHEVRIEGR